MTQRLSPEQISQFKRNGFIVPGITLPDEIFGQAKDAAEAFISANEGKPDLIRQVIVPTRDSFPADEGGPWHEPLFRLACSPPVLDVIEQLLGPDIILFTGFMIAKPRGKGREVPWHQDGHYSPLRPRLGLSIWIALEDIDQGNGCVRFVPKSGDGGLIPHYEEDRVDVSTNHNIDRTFFDPDTAVDAVLKPGQYSIHDVFTIHGSNENRSNRRRAGVIFNFMSAAAHYDRSVEERGGTAQRAAAATTRWPIWVVRGKNGNPNNDLRRGHEGVEHLDKIAAEAVAAHSATAGTESATA